MTVRSYETNLLRGTPPSASFPQFLPSLHGLLGLFCANVWIIAERQQSGVDECRGL